MNHSFESKSSEKKISLKVFRKNFKINNSHIHGYSANAKKIKKYNKFESNYLNQEIDHTRLINLKLSTLINKEKVKSGSNSSIKDVINHSYETIEVKSRFFLPKKTNNLIPIPKPTKNRINHLNCLNYNSTLNTTVETNKDYDKKSSSLTKKESLLSYGSIDSSNNESQSKEKSIEELIKDLKFQISKLDEENSFNQITIDFKQKIYKFFAISQEEANKVLNKNPFCSLKLKQNEKGLKTIYKFYTDDEFTFQYIPRKYSNQVNDKEYKFMRFREEAFAILTVLNEIKIKSYKNFSLFKREIENEFLNNKNNRDKSIECEKLSYSIFLMKKFNSLINIYEKEAESFYNIINKTVYNFYTLGKNIIIYEVYCNFSKKISSIFSELAGEKLSYSQEYKDLEGILKRLSLK